MDIAFSRPALRRWPLWHVALLVLLPVLVHLPELIGPALFGQMTSDPFSVLSVATTTRRDWLDGGLLPGLPGWIDGCAGVIVQALGHLVASDWRQGILPWWNPYSGVGMPLAGEYQPAAFFLPFVLLLGFPGGLLLMKIALQIVAGLAMYAFLRALRLDKRAVLLGALLYAFNGTYAWASDGPSQPLAFLPLVLFGIERTRTHVGIGGWGWLAVGLGYLLLSGFPETAFLVGTLGLVLGGVAAGAATGCHASALCLAYYGRRGRSAFAGSAAACGVCGLPAGSMGWRACRRGGYRLATGQLGHGTFPLHQRPVFLRGCRTVWRMVGHGRLYRAGGAMAGAGGPVWQTRAPGAADAGRLCSGVHGQAG
nr:hypothetical protein [Acetobacter malorum]